MKYPHILDGVIAASAPIWAFPGENPRVDSNAFAKTVTRDATPAGGASEACAGSLSSLKSFKMTEYLCQILCQVHL